MVSLTLRFNPHSSEFSQNDLCFFSSSGRQWPQCIEREWFGRAARQRRRTLPSRRRRHAHEVGDARPARADAVTARALTVWAYPCGTAWRNECILSGAPTPSRCCDPSRHQRRPLGPPHANGLAYERPVCSLAPNLEPTWAAAAASSRASSSALRRSAAARSRRPCAIGEIGCHRHRKRNTKGIGSGAAANLALDATCETKSAGS